MQTAVESNNFSRSPHVWKKHENPLLFYPNDLTHKVGRWVNERPVMQNENREPEFMGDRIIEENEEVKLARVQAENEPDIEHDKEVGDLFFFITSLAHNLRILEDVHFPSLSSAVNGLGARDQIHEQIREVAGNMNKRTVTKDVSWLFSAWMSYCKYGPVSHSPENFMDIVIKKNNGNHPAPFYSKRHPRTGRLLEPDEMSTRFRVSRAAFRTLRMFFGNPTEGLKTSQYLPYSDLINDFENSERALQELRTRLQISAELGKHLEGYYQSLSDPAGSYHRFTRDVIEPDRLAIFLPHTGLSSENSSVKTLRPTTSYDSSNMTVRFRFTQ